MNPLAPEGPEEEELLQEGEGENPSGELLTCWTNSHPVLFFFFFCPANKSRRVELSTASLLKVAPTNEEQKIIHDLFLNTLDAKYDQKFFS